MIVAALRRALLVAAASSEGMDVSLVAPLLLTVIVTTHAVASAACVSARTINCHLAASDTPRVAAAVVLTDTELDSTVAKQIDKLCSKYGVRMIIGALMAAHPQSTFSRKEEGGCVHGTARPDGSRSSPYLGPEAHRAVPRAQLHALRCLVRQRRLRRVARRRRHAVPPTLPSVMSPEVADHETRYAESSNLKHET